MQRTAQGIGEDWRSIWIGSLVFMLALAVVAGVDLPGWAVPENTWNDIPKSLAPASEAYAGMGGLVSLIANYAVPPVLMTIAAIMVSSPIVIIAVVELLILSFLAPAFLFHEPIVATAWMRLAAKTDGIAVASGAVTESLMRQTPMSGSKLGAR
jgi:hypothetical protein